MQNTEALTDLVKKLEEIEPAAKAVSELKEQTLEQEAAALKIILEKIKPLLPIISRDIASSYYFSGQQFHKERSDYFSEKGLELIDTFQRVCTDKDFRGDYSGFALILFQNGELKAFDYRGSWSNWQGESSSWEATDLEDISPEEACRRWSLPRLVKGLAGEVKEAREKLQEHEGKYKGRLELIAAVNQVLQQEVSA